MNYTMCDDHTGALSHTHDELICPFPQVDIEKKNTTKVVFYWILWKKKDAACGGYSIIYYYSVISHIT